MNYLHGAMPTRSATRSTLIPVCMCLLIAATATVTANAQTATRVAAASAASDSGGLEEIVVTAQRRAESEQRVAVAVNAFSAQDIERRGIEDMEGVAMRTPSFVFVGAGVADPQLYLRGVGTATALDAASESPVAVYVDDVYVGRESGVDFGMTDLERIEVLRGPQGTLFGRNSSGGVIQLITTQPQYTPSERISFTTGDYQRVGLDAFATGPLSDTVAFKLAGGANTENGYVLNETTGNPVGGISRVFVRGALRYKPDDALDIIFSSDVTRERGTSAAHDTLYSANPPLPPASDPSPFTTNAPDDGKQDRDLFNATLHVVYKMDWATLTSITGYRQNNYHLDYYFAGNPLTVNTIESFRDEREGGTEATQEFHLSGKTSKFDWIGGVFLMNMDVHRTQYYNQWFDGLFHALGLPQALWGSGNGLEYFNEYGRTRSWAVFVQSTYHITDKLGFTAGVRYSKDQVDASLDVTTNPANAAPIGLSVPGGYDTGPLSSTWSATTPHFALEYQATPEALLYASATRGYKSGIYNGTASTLQDASSPLNPELVWSYEAGAKTQWLNNRLRFNATGFYEDFKNLQIGTLIPGQAIIRQNASAIIRGAEIEISAVPIEHLILGVSYSYLHSRYTDPVHEGNVVAHSPASKVNVDAAYTIPVSRNLDLTGHVDWTNTGKFFMQPDNRPTEVQNTFDILNLSIDLSTKDGAWKASLWGKNVTNTLYELSQTGVPQMGQDYVIFGAPRTFGITVTRKF